MDGLNPHATDFHPAARPAFPGSEKVGWLDQGAQFPPGYAPPYPGGPSGLRKGPLGAQPPFDHARSLSDGSTMADEMDEGASRTWQAVTHRQLIRFDPPLSGCAAMGAMPTAGYLELPRGAALEISHLQMNAEKHLCYWGTHKAGPVPSQPGWISAADIVFT